MHGDTEQVFILGAPRSGTTFLASLMKYTRYKAPFETHFIPKYDKKLGKYDDLNDIKNFKKLVEAILAERPIAQHKISIDVDKFFSEFAGNVTYPALIDAICLRCMRNTEARAWGDKTPFYLRELETIFKLFPDAKYFYIVRDGRDVALSLLEKTWGPNNFYVCADYWNNINRENNVLNQIEEKGQLFTLKYEDLLDNPKEFIHQINQFLGEDNMEQETVDKLAATVKQGNYYKWKSKFSPQQLQLFESVAGDTLRRFGYETSPNPKKISGLKKAYYLMHHKLLWLKHMFVMNVIDSIKIKYFGKEPFGD